MSVLSIHIDESGNLNLSNKQNPEYCLTMVSHNQDNDISTEISVLDEKLENIEWDLFSCYIICRSDTKPNRGMSPP